MAHFISVDNAHIIKVASSMENKLNFNVQTFKLLVHTANDHKFAPGTLHHDMLIYIFNHITDISIRNNFTSFTEHPSDLFEVKASFIIRRAEHTILLILLIPFVAKHNLMPI